MSGVIGFKGGDFWGAAGWVFHGYLEQVRDEIGHDSELHFIVEQGMALHGLHLDRLAAEQLDRLGPVLLRVADEIVAGQRPVRQEARGMLSEDSQAQFRSAVDELRSLLREHLNHEEAPGTDTRPRSTVHRG
jgi:hypothetical protein